MAASPWHFEWAVDQSGYELVHVPAEQAEGLLSQQPAHDVIHARGGPLRYYWPLDEHPGLWRQFGERCSSPETALAFVEQFGLLSQRDFAREQWNELLDVLDRAELIRRICAHIDKGDMPKAAALWTEHAKPLLTAAIVPNERGTGFETELVPISLQGALMLQTSEAITRKQRWRRCRNENCPEWFRLGQGAHAHTARREFCSTRCRVAWARQSKKSA